MRGKGIPNLKLKWIPAWEADTTPNVRAASKISFFIQ
jgi:hypothetical protein